MRLRSAVIQSYRVHERLELDLDDDLVLVAGPNESGKSTAAEALHLALHLGSGYTGDLIKDLRGRASVDLRFEAGGHECHLRRVFGQPAELEVDGAGLRGEDADQRLAELLGTGGALGGGAARKQAGIRWSHLWVTQLRSSDDPALADETERQRLAGHLRALGGSAVAQTALDARVHAQLRAWADQDFVRKGSAPRAGSDVEQARLAVEAAMAQLTAQEENLARLQEAMDREEQAAADEERHLAAVAEAGAERVEVRRRLAEVEAVAADHARLLADLDARGTQLRDLADHLRELQDLERRDLELAGQITRLAAVRSEKEVVLAAARSTVAQREAEAREAARLAREARLAVDVLRTALEARRASAQAAELADQAREAEALQAQQLVLAGQAAALPGVGADDLDDLAVLSLAADQARSRLEGAAARICVVRSGRPVTIDGAAVAPGEERLLQDDAEIRVGDDVVLHLVPGGGASLGELRGVARSAEEALGRRLGALGVASLREAQDAVARRGQVEEAGRRVEADLRRLRAADLPERRRAADLARVEAEARLGEARARAPGVIVPDDDAALEQALGRADPGATAAATRSEHLEQELAAARALAAERQANREAADREYQELRTEAGRQQGALEARRSVHGSAADLCARHAALEADLAAVAAQTEARGAALAALQPEQLGRDLARLERVVTTSTAASGTAHDLRVSACTSIASLGGQGFHARHAEASAELSRASARHAALAERTRARALLAALFDEEMRRDDEALTRPLADRARVYLECLFGPGAHVEVTAPSGVPVMGALVRPAFGRFAFEALSVGTREQVGVAFRLALAELLAQSGHGCLPVVLDDAFANSDPERVRSLCRMLDLAATRGLQVIVLTCSPRDYQGLGAKENVLRPGRGRWGAAGTTAGNEGGEPGP